MKIVGIDLSLTSTGLAVIEDGKASVQRVQSKGSKDASLIMRSARIGQLVHDMDMTFIDADLVVVEGPSLGQQRQGGEHLRAGLFWAVIARCRCFGRPVAEVPPALVKKYATGKGNAPKDAVLAAVIRRYPDVAVTGNDEADALVLAAMGARHLGEPLEAKLGQQNADALVKVRWPGVSA